MSSERPWQEMVKHAEAYKQIGETRRWLAWDTKLEDYPWSHVVSVEPGSTHRLDISTSFNLRAEHPCGLTFQWSLDIEDREASGKGYYEINTPRIAAVMGLLPERARRSFKNYLADCAAALAIKGREWQGYTDRQKRDAKILADLAR